MVTGPVITLMNLAIIGPFTHALNRVMCLIILVLCLLLISRSKNRYLDPSDLAYFVNYLAIYSVLGLILDILC